MLIISWLISVDGSEYAFSWGRIRFCEVVEKVPKIVDSRHFSLAPARGFEPPTYRLGGGRSILLSYAGICAICLNILLLTMAKCQWETEKSLEKFVEPSYTIQVMIIPIIQE